MRAQITVLAIATPLILLGGSVHKAVAETAPPRPQATADSSKTSVDWPGTYTGVVPCDDCEGIETFLTLNEDLTYLIRTRYLGKSGGNFERQGMFRWNESGSAIELPVFPEGLDRYRIGENILVQFDRLGNRIPQDLAARYVLRKLTATATPAPDALFSPSRSWRLAELNGKPVTPKNEGERVPYLVFEKAQSRVSGFAGCNRFFGKAEFLEGNRLRLSNLGSTKMACPDMTVEDEFLKVLETTDSYHIGEGKLTLHRAGMAPLARFEPDRPQPE